jgi:hypothetical protein
MPSLDSCTCQRSHWRNAYPKPWHEPCAGLMTSLHRHQLGGGSQTPGALYMQLQGGAPKCKRRARGTHCSGDQACVTAGCESQEECKKLGTSYSTRASPAGGRLRRSRAAGCRLHLNESLCTCAARQQEHDGAQRLFHPIPVHSPCLTIRLPPLLAGGEAVGAVSAPGGRP